MMDTNQVLIMRRDGIKLEVEVNKNADLFMLYGFFRIYTKQLEKQIMGNMNTGAIPPSYVG